MSELNGKEDLFGLSNLQTAKNLPYAECLYAVIRGSSFFISPAPCDGWKGA